MSISVHLSLQPIIKSSTSQISHNHRDDVPFKKKRKKKRGKAKVHMHSIDSKSLFRMCQKCYMTSTLKATQRCYMTSTLKPTQQHESIKIQTIRPAHPVCYFLMMTCRIQRQQVYYCKEQQLTMLKPLEFC